MKADILIKNCSELLTCKANNPKRGIELNKLDLIYDGAIATKNDKIIFVGKTQDINFKGKKVIDAINKVVMPGFIDCHTHAIFAGSRENEFVKKLQDIPYLKILKQGGGILSTVKNTRNVTKEKLFKIAIDKFSRMMDYGTTTTEVKSGYGLSFEDEKKILEVAKTANKAHPIDIINTYLGAHSIPRNKSNEEYIKEILISLKKIKPYAEFCDVFCEEGVFSIQESRLILQSAKDSGFKLKIHAEQINTLHSAELASNLKAISADHLDHISEKGIEKMANSNTIGVLLPGASFFLMTKIYPPARKMIKKGVALAIATDFNPGSCPCENMQLMLTLACLQMKLLPAEAINCATINAAFAIDRANEIGSLEVGKKADIIILNAKNHNYIPYRFGINLVEKVIKNGKIIK